MAIWKVQAEGDTVYIEAPDREAAEDRLTQFMGDIPTHLLTFTIVDKMPDDEELL